MAGNEVRVARDAERQTMDALDALITRLLSPDVAESDVEQSEALLGEALVEAILYAKREKLGLADVYTYAAEIPSF